MHPLNGALPLPYVLAPVTRGDLFGYRHSFEHPRCSTSQHLRTLVPLSVSLWNDLSDPVFDDVGMVGFKSRVNAFQLPQSIFPFVSFHFLLFFLPWVGCVGLGSSD